MVRSLSLVALCLGLGAPLLAQAVGPRKTVEGPILEGAPASRDESEAKILKVLEDLDANHRQGMMNVPLEDGRLLRLLVESSNAKRVVEVGTSNGYSGIWLGLGLRKTGGHLITYELDPTRANLARQNFKRAGVDGLVTLIEGDAHVEVAKLEGEVDLVFLDADKRGYLDYLQKLLPKLRPGGLVGAHNINQWQADPRFLKAITTNPALETLYFHMDNAGISVSLKKR